jgi:arylsulfatase A-like enzyme
MFARLLRLPAGVGRFLWRPVDGSAGPDRRRDLAELLSLTFVVCLVLFLTKTVVAWRDLNSDTMPPPVVTDSWVVSLGQLCGCAAEDFAVGLGCLLAAGLALRFARRPGTRSALRAAVHVAAVAAIVYMLVNAQVFHVMRRFLTCSLVQLGGGLRPERSVLEYATPAVKGAFALVPLLALALHLFSAVQLTRFWQWSAGVVCRPLLLLAGIAGLAQVCEVTRGTLFSEHREDFTRNAHLLLARSFFFEPEFGDLGPEAPEFDDFRPGRPRLANVPISRRPANVVVIVLESGGSRYLDLFGGPFPATPRLSAMAPRAVRFDNFYATANNTIASALPLCAAQWNDPLTVASAIEYPTLTPPSAAVWMKRQGYRTGFLGSGGRYAWEMYRNLAGLVGQGWDVSRDPSQPFWSDGGVAERVLDDEYLDEAMFADARRFVAAERGRPFFLLLWNYDTHAPYFAPAGEEWDATRFPPAVVGNEKEEDFRRYLSSMQKADALIGGLVDELDRLGLADDTLIVVTGDHGEAFGQHGLFMHSGSLYEEELRVPLVLIHKGLADAVGTRASTIGSHIDLWPTIADVCGAPADPAWQGRSLLGSNDDRRAFFACRELVGVREGRWKYVWDFPRQRDTLFDLEADPDERVNVAGEHRDYCLRQRRRLRDWSLFQSRHVRDQLAGGQ